MRNVNPEWFYGWDQEPDDSNHTIETEDGWTCSACGRPINGYPGRDDGDSVRHL